MSSTETMVRSSLCFSGCGCAHCHLSVLPSTVIPMVLRLLPNSRLTALLSSPEPWLALLWDAKGRFGMTLPWAGSSQLLTVSASKSPRAGSRELVIVPEAMAEPALIPVFKLAELVSTYL